MEVKMAMPELPEGYFFRVTQEYTFKIYPVVELHQRKKRNRSKVIDWEWTAHKFDTVEEQIEFLANRLYRKFKERNYRESTKSRLMGDYPPKTLE